MASATRSHPEILAAAVCSVPDVFTAFLMSSISIFVSMTEEKQGENTDSIELIPPFLSYRFL